MSRLQSAFPLSLTLATAIFTASCVPEEVSSRISKGKLPIVRNLVDSLGREVEARVIARERNHITFIRTTDNREFRYSISNLSTEDQEWAISLPITSTQSPQVAEGALNNFTDFTEREISELKEEIAEARKVWRQIPVDTLKWRTQKGHIERLENRLARLQHNTL